MNRSLKLLIIAFLCYAHTGFSQNPKVDSLQSLLPNLEDRAKVEVLHSLIIELWLEYPDKAKIFAKKAISISTALDDERLQSISLRLMGGVQIYQGQYELSLSYTRNALEMALQLNDLPLISACLNNIGFNYYNLGSYPEAMDNFLRALNFNNRTEKKYGVGNTLNNIGLVYLEVNDFRKAREYFKQAVDVGIKSQDKNILLYASNNLGLSHLGEANYNQAEKYFKESLEIAQTVNNTNWEATAFSGLGQTYFKLGMLEAAHHEFRNSLNLRNKIGDLKGLSEIYHYLSRIKASKAKFDSAFYFLEISQSMANKVGTKDQLLENFKLYKELYKQQNQSDSALLYQSLYVDLREQQFEENAARSIAGIELEVKDEETAKELAEKDVQLAKKSFQLNFSIALAIFILLITVVLFWFYKVQRKQGKNLKIKNLKISYQRDEIIQKNEELSNLNREKNDLISIVAHDLKSPLNNIRGLIGIIKLPQLPPENQANQFIQLINESAIRLTDMIDKILDIEAIESKHLNLHWEKVNLSEVAKSLIDRYTVQAQNKEIEIHSSISENLLIKADKGYLNQIVENLLSNAIKFSPKRRNIYISLHSEENKAICEIKDEGPGLNKKDQKKLFRKYQKLSNAPTANETSTGLGLSIVKKYVDAMDGKIWCKSEEGKGASFFVSFPRSTG